MLIIGARTCAFSAGILFLWGAQQLAVEVFLPKLGKPDIPAIVLKGECSKVFIKPWKRGKRRMAQFRTNYQPIQG